MRVLKECREDEQDSTAMANECFQSVEDGVSRRSKLVDGGVVLELSRRISSDLEVVVDVGKEWWR